MRVDELLVTAGRTIRSSNRARRAVRALIAVAVGLGLLAVVPVSASAPASQPSSGASQSRFTGDRAETERFLHYDHSIELTAEQEAIRKEALDALPAPCCAKFSAATCCCRCNMALATWGLAKHLIVEQGAGVAEVRSAVVEWHRAINPNGFSGDACFTGGCARPFAQNGCGGMKEKELVF